MAVIAIIGGSGLTEYEGLNVLSEETIQTPYGSTTGPVISGTLNDQNIVFLARHGKTHKFPPHLINYRANLWVLKHVGIKCIVAVNAVGGIHPDMGPGHIVVPDQIIDYTHSREHTFSDANAADVQHIDFTKPYDKAMRVALLKSLRQLKVTSSDRGVYGCTQGPRFETAAEVEKLRRDGCDVVGMTGMPEAALAGELGLKYASICIVANWAAGKSDKMITMTEVYHILSTGMDCVKTLIQNSLKDLVVIGD